MRIAKSMAGTQRTTNSWGCESSAVGRCRESRNVGSGSSSELKAVAEAAEAAEGAEGHKGQRHNALIERGPDVPGILTYS